MENKLTNHVPNKENCLALQQALKAKGMKPMETMFVWLDLPKGFELRLNDHKWIGEYYPAPLVSELGQRLELVSDEVLTRAYGHVFNVPETRFITPTGLQKCMTDPNIACQMLTYLINNDLISEDIRNSNK